MAGGEGAMAQSQQAMKESMVKAKRAAELQAQIQARLMGLSMGMVGALPGLGMPPMAAPPMGGMPMGMGGPAMGGMPPPLLPGLGQHNSQQQQQWVVLCFQAPVVFGQQTELCGCVCVRARVRT